MMAQARPGAAAAEPWTVAVVLNHDKRDDLLACLRSLEQADPGPSAIVVVDNASSDGSAAAVAERFPHVHLLAQSENLGAAAGRNLGARYADQHFAHDTLLFLDDDSRIEREYLGRLREALSGDPAAAIACGKTYTGAPSRTIMSAGIAAKLYIGAIGDRGAGCPDRGQFDRPERIDAVGGFAFMIRREVFSQLGGFDERYTPYGWEDVDLCLRARRLGWLCRYAPNAIAYHKGTRVGRAPIPRYERAKARNYLRILSTHATPLQLLTCAFVVPLRAGLMFGRLVLRGHARAVIAQIRGTLDVLIGSW